MAGKRKDNKGRLLRTGERQRPDGMYEYRVQQSGGKRKSVYAGTLEELRKLEDRLTADRHEGIRIGASAVVLDDLYYVWCESKRGLKDNTFQNYKYMYTQFVSPNIGKLKIEKIKKSDIKRFYNQMVDEDGLKLSTVESMHTVVHQVLQVAVDDNYIRTNPADGALRELKASHQYDSEKRRALTVDQQRLLMEYLERSDQYKHWKPLITVMLGTGMRVGEVTGLRWKDIDFEQGTIDVNHTLVFYNKEHKSRYAINTTKTPSSKRVIPMIDSVREAFLEEKRNQEKSGVYCISVIDGFSDFIFCNRFGEILNLGVINKALRRIMRDCNEEILEEYEGDDMPVLLPRFSCHTFRHTFTTRMCESGMNMKVIQGMLGHSDISTTMNIYADVTKELEEIAIKDLERYLDEKKIS
jgi:integrase